MRLRGQEAEGGLKFGCKTVIGGEKRRGCKVWWLRNCWCAKGVFTARRRRRRVRAIGVGVISTALIFLKFG